MSGLVAGALGKNTVTVDLADSGLDFSAVSMTEDDVAVISVPAYAVESRLWWLTGWAWCAAGLRLFWFAYTETARLRTRS
ncbi:MAG: hypothetical protein ACLTXI_03270 [Collinsella sp.]